MSSHIISHHLTSSHVVLLPASREGEIGFLMKSIALIIGVLVVLAVVAKDYSWRVKGAIFAGILAMIFILMR